MTSARPRCPYEGASLLSKLTYGWITKMHLTTVKGNLQEEDLYEPPSWARANHRVVRFQSQWEHLPPEERCRRGSLFKCMAICFWKPLAVAWTIAVLSDLLKMTQPVIVAMLVQYLSGSENITDKMAYFLVAAMAAITIVDAVLYGRSYYLLHITSMNMRSTCAALIFQKVTTLNTTSGQGISTGHIVNLMATDIESFHLGMSCSNIFIVSPLTLLTVGLVVGFDIGLATLAGFAIILLYIATRLGTGILQGKISNETSAHMKSVLFLYTSLATCLLMGKITSYVILSTYIAQGHALTPDIAVKLIGWMKTIEMNVFIMVSLGFSSISEMITAFGRIQDFMNADDLEVSQDQQTVGKDDTGVVFDNVSATWCRPDNQSSNPMETEGCALQNVTFDASPGQLVVIVGPIGAGKSSLLMATLKELYLMKGEVRVNGSVAYVPQESWILSDTVRANILMGKDMQPELYDAVISACGLDIDIDQFPAGSSTLVGERGLSLSGGQKARINLARALYHDADIYLLDDPLSAVDTKVGNIIFKECIFGILESKIRILVTHQLHYVKYADKVVVMDKGKVVSVGSYEEVSADVNLEAYVGKREKSTRRPSVQTDFQQDLRVGYVEGTWKQRSVENDPDLSLEKAKDVSDSGQLRETAPTLEAGAASYHVYRKYFKAGYGTLLGPLIVVLTCAKIGLDVTSDWMMSTWNTNTSHPVTNGTVLDYSLTFPEMLGALVGGLVAASYVQSVLIAVMLVTASRRLYGGMFDRVLKAPMVFFERHPVGEILNRFSRDTGFMDNAIPYSFYFVVDCPGRELVHIVYACVVFPWMTIAVIVTLTLVGGFGYLSMKCQCNIKRIEGQLRSPTYSHLSAMLDGIKVIRAHRLEKYFLGQASDHLDRHSSAWFLYLSSLRYLSFGIKMLIAALCLVYMAIVLAVQTEVGMGGAFGLSFIYLYSMAVPIQLIIGRFAEVQMAMTSVARILQYNHLEQEAPDHTDVTPPSGWPSSGQVTFKDVSVIYRGSCTAALGPLSVRLTEAEKIGIVGRTGAGKSSFFGSLLRMVEPTGSITIDGVDITKIGLAVLRNNISVIPQDPMLFSGLLRDNLDPFSQYNDEQLWHVLKQVQLSNKVRRFLHGLYTEVGEAGSGFSTGQRQLLCLARALLKNNKIIIIDEATANVDYRTDSIIQKTLSVEFSGRTVLTIAHRLATVITYDKIMVLDQGKLVQFGHPHTLLQDTDGPFYGMIHQLIPTEARHLEATAKLSYIRRLDKKSTNDYGGEGGREITSDSMPVITTDIAGFSNMAYNE